MNGIVALHRNVADEWVDVTKNEFIEPSGPSFRNTRSLMHQERDGTMFIGQWACEPGAFLVKNNPYLEFCRVVEGRIRVSENDGRVQEFGPGDWFVIPFGYSGRCEILSLFRKDVVASRPL